MIQADLVVRNVASLVTCAGAIPRAGAQQGDIGEIPTGALASRAGRLVFVGTQHDLEESVTLTSEATVLEGAGTTVIPGFCDAHTHLPFAGTREDEFARRAAGATYQEIAAAGGGILSTVTAVRAASEDALTALAMPRLRRMLEHGTTSIEAKSGYGLTLKDELKQLAAIRRLDAGLQPVEITPTLLAAHTLPPEFERQPERLS